MNFFKKYKNIFFLGLLGGLAFPPLYLIIFLPISFYYLLKKIVNCNNYKEVFLYGLIFGFGYYLTQIYWISFSLFVDIKTYFWLFPFAISIIPLACAFYISLSILLTFYLIKKFSIKNNFLISIIFAFSYVIFEYLKGFIFPWNLFAYIIGFSNILSQIVSIINIYILDFILIIFSCFGFVLIDFENKKFQNKNYTVIYIIIFLIILIFGIVRLHNTETIELNQNFRLIQANIKQSAKWNRNESENNLKKHIELSSQEGLDKTDIIVWSESSMPFLLTKNSTLDENFDILKDKIIITGAVRGEIKNNKIEKVWNSIFIFKNKEIIDYYDKTVLVPFGEYIPFSKYIPFIEKLTDGAINFSRGEKNRTIEINGLKISPIICYEVIFPNKVIDKNNKPDIIINLTNDGWFGISSGPYQHLVAAQFRAIENKIPIIRVSNSGISAYIDEYGRIKAKMNLQKVGILDI
ncbi:MAG TPA: apolipoprotein N-acyltransferase [Rickettsiales bacterium]|nr:apolipoprotein N-acyltransferase [Rickettsiales bacterium]